MLNLIEETSHFLKNKIEFSPEIGIILGTGLGGLVDEIDIKNTLAYEDIPHFPVSTVDGHHGQLIFGEIGGKNVVAYEDFTLWRLQMSEVVFPVRVMKLLG